MSKQTKISRRTLVKGIATTGALAGITHLASAANRFAESVRSSTLQLNLAANGSITNAHFRGLQRSLSGEMRLAGSTVEGNTAIHRSGQTIAFERRISCGKNRARTVERFSPTANGIRWQVEITGEGAPWTTPIEFHLRYPVTQGAQFWTAWADPDPAQEPVTATTGAGKPTAAAAATIPTWHDPLVTMPPRNRKLYYGAPPLDSANPRGGFTPSESDLFSLPVATFSEALHDAGLSVVLGLDNPLLDLTLDTSDDGGIVFTYLFHRISARTPVNFTIDLVPHEAGWRGGLRYLVQQHPDCFNPVNVKTANELSGTAAYPNSTAPPFDPDKLKAMAFRTVWVASYDFPYMGMFLPPVADSNVPWPRFSTRMKEDVGTTTVRQMAEYATHMRKNGFHVLNYFNVTEFGAHMTEPWKAAATSSGAEQWDDPREFVQKHFPAAVLRKPDGTPFYSWGGAIAMDVGDPAYREFIRDQARRHLKSFPDSDGFCIDRLDWLRHYNDKHDDHASWFGDSVSQSLIISWRQLIEKLGPEVHDAGKTIFVNNDLKRIDVLRGIDGIYDEFGYYPASLNTTALVGVRRPVLAWTRNADNLHPDPDAFFQRNLYLGVYPTAPVPGNDHSIKPDAWVDQQYSDYGPLMDAMRGKRWVLLPHSIKVVAGAVRVNLFETPAGYVIPVVLGGSEKEAIVELQGVEARAVEVLHPGSSDWKSVHLKPGSSGKLRITVPLVRGCAILRLH